MNAKEILKKIKAVFEEVPPAPAEPTPVEFKEYSLADGTKVMIDKLEIGGKVMVVAADGTETKAPEGEHMLATGEAIEVDAEGLIYEIKSAVAADTPEMMQQKMKDMVQKFAVGTPEERLSGLETMSKALMEYAFGWQITEQERKAITDQAIAVYKQSFETQMKAKDDELKKVKQGFKELVELVETIADIPAEKPIEPQRNQFFEPLDERQRKILAAQKGFETLNKQ